MANRRSRRRARQDRVYRMRQRAISLTGGQEAPPIDDSDDIEVEIGCGDEQDPPA